MILDIDPTQFFNFVSGEHPSHLIRHDDVVNEGSLSTTAAAREKRFVTVRSFSISYNLRGFHTKPMDSSLSIRSSVIADC